MSRRRKNDCQRLVNRSPVAPVSNVCICVTCVCLCVSKCDFSLSLLTARTVHWIFMVGLRRIDAIRNKEKRGEKGLRRTGKRDSENRDERRTKR